MNSSRRSGLLPAAAIAVAIAAMPAPARAADGYVWASFTTSNDTYFLDTPYLHYLGGPSACPKATFLTAWGGHWLTIPGFGSFWIWSGYNVATLIAEQHWEIKSVCAPTGCIHNANSYCAYCGLVAVPQGAVQSSLALACPNSSQSAPVVQAGPITTISPGIFSAGLSDRLGPASKLMWADWNTGCGVTPPPNTLMGF